MKVIRTLKLLPIVLLSLLALGTGATALLAQPAITQQPANQTLAAGGTLSLGVTVSGTAPVYQWFKDSRFIVGETNGTLTIANAGVTNTGLYCVAVTNSGGMVISLPAAVMVGNPILAAWGENNYGQLGNGTTNNTALPVMVANNVVTGGAGLYHSIFVEMDGTLWAMGYNSSGQLGNSTTSNTNLPVSVASNVVAAAAGGYHSLFVKTNGTLWAMGDNTYGQLGKGAFISTNRPTSVASNVVAVTAGYRHSLFIKTNGTLWAMGLNNCGQLGDGTTISTNQPICVASNVVAVAAGGVLVGSPIPTTPTGHSLFVKSDGTLWAMGYNGYGQLGNGTYNDTYQPTCVASNVVAVAAGPDHSLFVKTNGTLWAMGHNSFGQLGNGTTTDANRPICVASNVVAVAAGYMYSLFIQTNGTLWATGWNYFGALGDGTVNNATSPIQVTNASLVATVFPGERAYHAMAMGNIHSLATVTLGNLIQIYTGNAISVTASTTPPGLAVNLTYNGSPNPPTNVGAYTVIGTINDPNAYGSATNTLVIQPIGPTNQTVAVGGTLSMSVTMDSGSQLGFQWFKDSRFLVGETNNTLTTANAGVTNSGVYYLVASNAAGIVISQPALVTVGNPVLMGWGYNQYGQLGNGTTINTNRPVIIATNVVAGAAGDLYSLFVTSDGTLWAMGDDSYGQFGNGTTTSTNLPISVASNVVAVAAGDSHSLFVTTNGTLWAMGYNGYGQLGNGTYNNTNRPVCVASNVVAVTAGFSDSLFVKADGTLWAMGHNSRGQLGNGTMTDTSRPVCVASNVVAVAAGNQHTLFVTLDGTLWAMGYNSDGQLGNGTTINTNRPISVASNVVAVAAGGSHSLFVKTNGTLWAMGDNSYGQFGNGNFNGTNRPTSVASNVVAAVAENAYSLFTKTDGSLWAMGANSYGQLGNGATSNTNLPVNVPQLLVANVFPADQANHSLAIGTIVQSLATVTLGNLNQGYTGSAISVTSNTTPPGLAVNLTYNGSAAAPTNPGSYTVIGSISDLYYYGSVTNTLMVGARPQNFTGGSAGLGGQPQLALQLSGTPYYPYILQCATNLTPPVNWQPVWTNPADADGNWSFTVSNLTGTNCFYRAASQ